MLLHHDFEACELLASFLKLFWPQCKVSQVKCSVFVFRRDVILKVKAETAFKEKLGRSFP
jgi:hypothetical protein